MKKLILCIAFFFSVGAFFPETSLTKIGTYECGRQPKQVLFSPDSNFIVMPLLDDTGFDIFDVAQKKILKRINPPGANELGFAEGMFVPSKKAFFVSQMTTGNIHEYSYPGFEFRRTVSTGGNWSKFMAYSPQKNLVCVSNWVSDDISLIDYESGNVLRKIKTGAAPRGLAFLSGGKEILVLCFDGGKIQKFNTEDGAKLSEIEIEKSAMRHVVVNDGETKAFVSDMFYAMVYELDLKSFKIERKIKVFNNPNTIDLKGDRYLFVSCRGPNNKVDYTKRSPLNGKIYIIDTHDMSIAGTFDGGNQPTGLDVDAKGKLLCFSNFQDQNIEIYEID